MIAVIQLDGLGAEPLERLLAAGEMPNLAGALARTPPVPLRTPAPLFPAAVYPTLYSGLEPDEHGLFYPFQWDPGAQRIVIADDLPAPPALWRRLGDRGARSLVVDPYECGPSPAPGARVISGWQLSERVVLRRWSRPPSIWPLAAARMGLPPRATEVFGEPSRREAAALARRLRRAPARVAALAERELTRTRFDHAWISFVAAHVGGHRLWGTPALDAVYRATDEALGRVLAALPSGARTILLCPIGMSGDETAADLLPEMLARVLGSAPKGRGSRDGGPIWRLRSAVPSGLRRSVSASLPGSLSRRLTARLELHGVDWSRTVAFAHPSDNQGYVRLNLEGRERRGIVEPARAEELCAEIADGLASFRRPSGSPAVESVHRSAAPGPQAGLLPDLVVRWTRTGEGLGSLHSERFGSIRRRGAGSGRSGNHPDDGAWIAGDGISRPAAGAVELSAVAPAIAARLDSEPAGGDRPRPSGPPSDRDALSVV